MRYGDDILTDEYRSVLSLIQQADPSAVMAGGCLRDRVMEREVKDIDIFVGPEWSYTKQMEAFAQSGQEWDLSPQFTADVIALYSQHFGESMTDIYKAQRFAQVSVFPFGHEVQIIRLKEEPELTKVIRDLDFGFCQIGYGPVHGILNHPTGTNNYLAYTMAFWRDVQRKVVTLHRGSRDPNFERSLKRAERLKQKYPDFDFILPAPEAYQLELF